MTHAQCKQLFKPGREVYISATMLDSQRLWLLYELRGNLVEIVRIWPCEQKYTLGANYDQIPQWSISQRNGEQQITDICIGTVHYVVANPRKLFDYE